MRPIRRGRSPQETDFKNYRTARPELVSRLGPYCSYCERRLNDIQSIEHIEPKKGLHGKPELEGRWENFLLTCVNCNSIKGSSQVLFAELFFPDRDNTFIAFTYTPDGKIAVSKSVSENLQKIARAALQLTGLDREDGKYKDENGELVALDRVGQRMQAWSIAQSQREKIAKDPSNNSLKDGIVKLATFVGFFSVWMTVFIEDAEIRKRLIEAFDDASETGNIYGCEASGCFDPVTTTPISPAPNPDELESGGKI